MKNLIVNALATRRLTRLVLDDKILETPRQKLLTKYPPESTLAGYFLTCPWCISVYSASAIVALTYFAPSIGKPLADVLAYSEATGLLAENGF